MKRFVQLIVARIIVLVGALWALALFEQGSGPRIAGSILVFGDTAGVLAGICSEIEL